MRPTIICVLVRLNIRNKSNKSKKDQEKCFSFAFLCCFSDQHSYMYFALTTFIDSYCFSSIQFVTPTTYDNCITNQSYNERNCLSAIQRQRRENLIKLDLQSNYMTKYEAPMQIPEDNSAGSSVESSPVDSLLDDQGEFVNIK